jgi:hypothetical protein
MSKEPKFLRLTEVVATAALQVANAAVPGTLSPIGTGVLALVPPALGSLLRAATENHARAQAKRLENWLNSIATLLGLGSDEATRLISEEIDEKWAHEAITEGVRAIFLDIDEAALPCLAAVTAHQLQERCVTRRHRRTVALLADCDNTALLALQAFISFCLSKVGDHKGRLQVSLFTLASTVQEMDPPPAGTTRLRLSLVKIEASESSTRDGIDMWPARETDLAVLGLLQRHGFLWPGPTTSPERFSEGECLNLLASSEDLRFLAMILAPSHSSVPLGVDVSQ